MVPALVSQHAPARELGWDQVSKLSRLIQFVISFNSVYHLPCALLCFNWCFNRPNSLTNQLSAGLHTLTSTTVSTRCLALLSFQSHLSLFPSEKFNITVVVVSKMLCCQTCFLSLSLEGAVKRGVGLLHSAGVRAAAGVDVTAAEGCGPADQTEFSPARHPATQYTHHKSRDAATG